jgi:hypothetical protein
MRVPTKPQISELLKPMPSPRGTNKAGLFIRTTILSRAQALAFDAANGIGGGADPLTSMRIDIENALSELDLDETQIAKVLDVLDEHASFSKLDGDHPQAERAAELAGDDDDDDAEKLKKFRALLRKAGLSDADVDEAISIANGGGKAKQLPVNGTNGGIGGALADRRPAMDEAALASLEADMDRQFGCGRITSSPAYQAADRRTVVDDSDAELARFAAMYPQAERIGRA